MPARRPRRPLVTEPPYGYEMVTTRRVLATEEINDPLLKALRDALVNQDRLVDMDAWFRVVFAVGVEKVLVERLLSDGSQSKIGFIGAADVQDQMETWFLDKFGGPGKFVMKPIRDGVWIGPSKKFILGWASDPTAGLLPKGEGLESIDVELARHLKRETAVSAIGSIRRLNAGELLAVKGDDDVKGEDLARIIEALGKVTHTPPSDRTQELLIEMLRQERAASTGLPPWMASLAPLLTAAGPALGIPLALFFKRLAPALADKVLAAPAVAGPNPPTLMETVTTLIRELGPLVQPFLARMADAVMAVGPAPAALSPARVSAPLAIPSGVPKLEQEESVKVDADVLTYVQSALTDRRFADVLAAFRQDPILESWLAKIVPGTDPAAYWLGIVRIDPVFFRERKDVVCDFIADYQDRIKAALAADLEAEPPA